MNQVMFFCSPLLASLTAFCNSPTAGNLYTIGTWRGFASAAVSFTFDDGCRNQFSVAIPMFDQKQFKLTLFTVITGGMFPGWKKLESAAVKGHEIASHTMTHASLKGLEESKQEYELKNSRDSINAHIPGRQCITMAYPYCEQGIDALCEQYYIAARTCSGQIVPRNPKNFNAISSFGCGSESSNNSTAALNKIADNAVVSNGWCVYLFHGIENDGGYSPVSTATLQGCVDYMDANRDKFWVETFGNVARYIRERNAVSIEEIAVTPDSITLRLTDTLDDNIFNYPISILRRLPDGWRNADVFQAGNRMVSGIRDSLGATCVIFDAVPDGGGRF